LINAIQPWLKIDLIYGLSIGIKAVPSPFNQAFRCYGGSCFHVCSSQTAIYLYHYSQENSERIRYFSRVIVPDESYIKTVLLNTPQLTFANYAWMYADFSETKSGHPRTLSKDDYSKLVQSEAYFARKFESNSEVLDLLDRRIFDTLI
jgi:hypothetical protein